MQWFWGEVYAKTPGLYQVPNWSYGQKNQKKGGIGELRGGPRGRGVVGRSWGDAVEMQGFWGRSTRKPQVSIKSLTGVMAKKLKKWGNLDPKTTLFLKRLCSPRT